MSIPVDLPGGEKMHEWPAPNMQPGVEQVAGGGFRGVVLIGQAGGAEASVHACEPIRELSDTAYGDALSYVAQHKPGQTFQRDDVSEHL
ncbi:hypothetical protein [Herbaspirillum robiniae]|uniref:Uncharacterized protein n=1 Tax=Herbaspirillum robiniae TaxID=2014887 RepID=A0A246WWS4_9BURK|nr:hypothetical protein [Herbaspirillum robiniae]NUU01271.1 hypothetical protein [Herbaspirillum robiniae]OWY31428.1 hypothetical protein CEJ42_01085 [Herbaspirillum robiniae]